MDRLWRVGEPPALIGRLGPDMAAAVDGEEVERVELADGRDRQQQRQREQCGAAASHEAAGRSR
jgi:hypothetical protein